MNWRKRWLSGIVRPGAYRLYLGGLVLLALMVGIGAGLSLTTRTVSIQVEGQTIVQNTRHNTVGEVIQSAGIEVGPEDLVRPSLETSLAYNQTVEVVRSFPVVVLVDGQELEVVTCPTTLKDIVQRAGIQMGPLDRIDLSPETWVDEPTEVKVVRVEQKEITEKVKLPVPVERTQDQTLVKGIQRTVQAGSPGVEQRKLMVTFEDGQEVKREVISSEIVKPAIKKIVAVGALTSVSRGGTRIEFDRAMQVRATAYSYNAGSRTSTGQRVRVGGIAVDPRVIPYGTRVYVEGYGYATAIDCGGAIKGNRIDVFFETEKECRRWGVKNTMMYILE